LCTLVANVSKSSGFEPTTKILPQKCKEREEFSFFLCAFAVKLMPE